MWAGNVPPDARHDELWRFFTEGANSVAHGHGILSIFLIPHSACAFVNYSSAAALSAAIAQFDGSGAHSESARNMNEDKDAATSSSASPGGSTSTTSSMLARHFPQRFFILKSLTREDLDLSVRTGVWATQQHNEGVLDRAFRTAADVVLIFSVNKSGEFYGWARCSAPALHAMRSSASLSVLPAPKPKRSLDPMVLRELQHPLAASLGTENRGTGAPADTRTRDGGGRQEGEGEGWGQNFALHWICTASLPFTRTQSLRNPWNRGRQVKIARDGTEIEPAVGHALIEQWSGSGADEMLQGLKLAE
ncbi:YT521-B-like domain-containing protein [Mycena galopus ATCC 62051]|nr:YT521-B-like domain-containing protein [Mycena galopus ATCC 62051]